VYVKRPVNLVLPFNQVFLFIDEENRVVEENRSVEKLT
jgi:hypothetical protein